MTHQIGPRAARLALEEALESLATGMGREWRSDDDLNGDKLIERAQLMVQDLENRISYARSAHAFVKMQQNNPTSA